MRLLFLACSATKRPDEGLLRAIDRYDGPAFRLLRKFLRERAVQAGKLGILILSAEFGLIAADMPIPCYDRRMDVQRAIELRPQVRRQAQALLAGRPIYTATLTNLGAAYTYALTWDEATMPLLGRPQFGVVTHAQGPIGQRLQQMKRWLEAADA
jgi:hypothetical protein